MLRQPHTLTYGSDLLPFLEILPTLSDEDSAWAKAEAPSVIESDESDLAEEDFIVEEPEHIKLGSHELAEEQPHGSDSHANRASGRDRKSSLPLAAKSILHGSISTNFRSPVQGNPPTIKETLARLVRVANTLMHYDADAIAQEITRRDMTLFLQIEVSCVFLSLLID